MTKSKPKPHLTGIIPSHYLHDHRTLQKLPLKLVTNPIKSLTVNLLVCVFKLLLPFLLYPQTALIQKTAFQMASNSAVLILLLVSLSSFHLLSVTSFEFQVGDINGWIVPPENDSKIFNDWASENRFQVGDTIRKHCS